MPCDKCQEQIEKEWDWTQAIDSRFFIMWCLEKRLCKTCKQEVEQQLGNETEVILGNSECEPAVELSRSWIDDDNSVLELTEGEYRAQKN